MDDRQRLMADPHAVIPAGSKQPGASWRQIRTASWLSALCCLLALLVANPAWSDDAQTKSLDVPCGKAEMLLKCLGDDCNTTSLRLKGEDGQTTKLSRPRGLERYTAVGLGCAKATDGTPYFIVQYGELPQGCEFCEWFHLYSTQGELLTHSDPAILTDASAPAAHAQSPNNAEFDALDRKLGLGRPHLQFIQ